METNDPHLSKTPIEPTTEAAINRSEPVEANHVADASLDDKLVDTEHVNEGDMPARQPDRRDQEGDAFDDGVNDKTTAHASPHNPKSDEINDLNRYASVDNAQTRVLNTTDQQD